VKKDCCIICQKPVPCDLIACANKITVCPDGYKLVVIDGDCCPSCQLKPPCPATIACLPCPAGTTATPTDLSCCPLCNPVDVCAGVVCAKPNCTIFSTIKRAGQCCLQCPTCADNANLLCDPNDDQKCKDGFFTGTDCATPVPPVQRIAINFTVQFCQPALAAAQCPIIDVQTIRILIVSVTKAPASSVTVTAVGSSSLTTCCIRYTVTIASTVGSAVDVPATTTDVKGKLNASTVAGGANFIVDGYTPTPTATPTKASASAVALSTLLIGAAALF